MLLGLCKGGVQTEFLVSGILSQRFKMDGMPKMGEFGEAKCHNMRAFRPGEGRSRRVQFGDLLTHCFHTLLVFVLLLQLLLSPTWPAGGVPQEQIFAVLKVACRCEGCGR